MDRGGASRSGGCARSRRDYEQEELDGGGLVAVNCFGEGSSAGGSERERKRTTPMAWARGMSEPSRRASSTSREPRR